VSGQAIPTEHEEQAALIRWTEYVKPVAPELGLLFAIPNGGARSKRTGKALKEEGVKPGVPDLCLPVARSGLHGLWLEMKRIKGGRVEPVQKEWHQKLKDQGYAVVVCRGWVAAKDALIDYLGLEVSA